MTLPGWFTAKVAVESSGCWTWTAHLDADGYGRLSRRGFSSYAHRVAYELQVGPIPSALVVDHLCRVRHCVNPAHLEPVTFAENIRRGVSAHGSKPTCPSGHDYDEANTYRRAGKRHCRACNCEKNRRYRARKKASV